MGDGQTFGLRNKWARGVREGRSCQRTEASLSDHRRITAPLDAAPSERQEDEETSKRGQLAYLRVALVEITHEIYRVQFSMSMKGALK